MHPSFDPREFDYTYQFRQVGFAGHPVCFELNAAHVVRRVSPSARRVLGYEPAELSGRHILDLFPKSEADAVRRSLAVSCLLANEDDQFTLLGKHGAPVVVTLAHVPSTPAGGELDGASVLLALPASEVAVEKLAVARQSSAAIGEYYDEQDYSHDRNFHFGLYEWPDEALSIAADRLIAEFCSQLAPLAGKEVLDIGCGTGDIDVRLVSEYQCARVHAVTNSRHQMELCGQAASAAGVSESIRFCLADANEMSAGDQAYDVAIAIESLFHMDRDRVLAHVWRALKPGGTFAFCDIYPLEGGIVHSRSGEHTFVSLNQTVRLLRKHGFRNIRLIDWSDRVLPSYTNLFGIFVGIAAHAIKKNFTAEQTFQAAANFFRRPLSPAVKAELVAEVFAQARGQSKSRPAFGYFFASAQR
jgi:cyclopropane fatty-acyl-phospholipid synthase-like methyltransferase